MFFQTSYNKSAFCLFSIETPTIQKKSRKSTPSKKIDTKKSNAFDKLIKVLIIFNQIFFALTAMIGILA